MVLKKVSAGEAFKAPAPTWNAFIDAAQAHRAGFNVPFQRSHERNDRSGVRVLVQNTSGADVDWGEPLKIQEPAIDQDDNLHTFRDQPSFVGYTPSANNDVIVIASEPIPDGKIGLANLTGVVAAQISVSVDSTAIDRVAPGSGGALEQHAGGPHRILHRETGTGTKWAYLLLNEFAPARYRGTTSANIASGASGSVDIGTVLGGPAFSVTATNHGAEQVDSGDDVVVEWLHAENKWILTSVDAEISGGGGSLQCLTLNWSASNPNITLDPDQSVNVIEWASGDLIENGTGMTFDHTRNSISYDGGGDYLLWCSADMNNLDGETEYASGHSLEGHLKMTGNLRIYLQKFDTTWQTHLWNAGYASPSGRAHDSADFVVRIKVPAGPAEEYRLVAINDTVDSSDARGQVFHARWHSLRIGA